MTRQLTVARYLQKNPEWKDSCLSLALPGKVGKRKKLIFFFVGVMFLELYYLIIVIIIIINILLHKYYCFEEIKIHEMFSNSIVCYL